MVDEAREGNEQLSNKPDHIFPSSPSWFPLPFYSFLPHLFPIQSRRRPQTPIILNALAPPNHSDHQQCGVKGKLLHCYYPPHCFPLQLTCISPLLFGLHSHYPDLVCRLCCRGTYPGKSRPYHSERGAYRIPTFLSPSPIAPVVLCFPLCET